MEIILGLGDDGFSTKKQLSSCDFRSEGINRDDRGLQSNHGCCRIHSAASYHGRFT